MNQQVMPTGLSNKLRLFSAKVYWKEILAVFMLLLAIFFFRNERKDLHSILPHLRQASPLWLSMGLLLTVVYFILQAGMYRKSFAAVGLVLKWIDAVLLFLKRNFIGVFMPAGGLSAMAYLPSDIRKAGFKKMAVHQASGLFWFAGLVSVFIAGLPVLIYTLFARNRFSNSWIGLLLLLFLMTVLFIVVRSIRRKGYLYRWIDKRVPAFAPAIHELFDVTINTGKFSGAIACSLGVELCGMVHVYVAMIALGAPASWGAAASSYIVSVLLMMVSPFLKGLGAVELSMVYVLVQFGYSPAQSLSITILYRVFEFWLPLLGGLTAFAWKGRQIFLRLAPALLTFLLGLVNIISSVTPPIHQRLGLLREYLPLSVIHASHLLVFFVGLFLIVASAYLVRGLRNAWIMAIVLSIFSLIGHLTKALDYEEAICATITILVLLITASQYRIRSSHKWIQAGVKMALISLTAVLLFGFVSFYFIDVRHFGVDFTWKESLLHTGKIFLLVNDTTLKPVTVFGHEFILFIRSLGFLTWGFLAFTLIRPHYSKHTIAHGNYREKAKFLLSQFGNSSIDYFKTYKDKLFFFSDVHEAFIAYRIAGGFAIVLEEPVCAGENKLDVLTEFDRHCRKMGLKPAFYRVDESSIPWFNELRKSKLMIGQEAIMEVSSFSLEGKEQKSLRNGLSSLQKKGYTSRVNFCPHTTLLLDQLRKVSDEWLKSSHKAEFVFSQGMFDEKELQQQDIITLCDDAGEIKAFLNIIPDYAENECTYDLIRKSPDAPGAAMDALIIELIQYARNKNYLYLNLGMVPMTGLTRPDNPAEQIIKLAAEKIKRFRHYQGLREFKDKYATLWENKYLVYDNDFDLLQLPAALNKVMRP